MTDTPWTHGLVTPRWVFERQDNPAFKVIDGTWSVTQQNDSLAKGVIPGALFFDLGHLKSITPLGSSYPPRDGLVSMLEQLGIQDTDSLVIYDRHGLFSAPRLWWSLKTIGHKKATVLRGGLPAWIKNGYAVTSEFSKPSQQSRYIANPSQVEGVTIDDVVATFDTSTQIIDARPLARFLGTMPEPRKGLRSGHIPGSLSLPLSSLKNDSGQLLNEDQLLASIDKAGIDLNEPIITTCGSGVTAAALALIFHSLGKTDVAVYTGSWTEYGASVYPIQTG